MPPALSDSEHDSDSSDDRIPATKKSPEPVPSDAADDNDDGASDDGAEEYVVEKIMAHRFVKGKLEYDVKWQGYDNPKDRTWEPEDNMEGAADVLAEYHEEIGGRPEPKATKGTKRGRPSGVKSESGTPVASSKRGRPNDDKLAKKAEKAEKVTKAEKAEKAWSPPTGSWEHEVSHIETVEQSPIVDPKTGQQPISVYIVWNNQRKTQHPLQHIYQKCPQKMLLYYESHLIFKETPEETDTIKDYNDTNGDETMKNS